MFKFLSLILSILLTSSLAFAQINNGGASPNVSTATGTLLGINGGTGGQLFANLTNIDSLHLPYTRSALAATLQNPNGGSDTIINCVGDSTEAGVYNSGGSGSFYTNGRVTSTCAYMAQLLTQSGIPATMDNWFGDAAASTHSSSLTSYYPNVTYSGAWAASTGVSVPGGYAMGDASDTAGLVTKTSTNETNAIIFYVTNSSLGTFTYSVDGGSASSPVSEVGSAGISTVNVPLGASGTHTITINRASGSIFIAGVDFYNSTQSRVRLRNLGYGGSQTSAWVATANGWNPGNQLNTANYAASLTYVNLGINDYLNSTAPATTAANLATLYGIIQANASSDIISIIPFPSASSSSPLATQAATVAAIVAQDSTSNIPVMNWNARTVSYAQAITWGFAQTVDGIHPLITAYADQARWRAELLGEVAGRGTVPQVTSVANGGTAISGTPTLVYPTDTITSNGSVGLGYNALSNVTSGTNLTALGYLAGNSDTTGYNNVLIGWKAGASITTGHWNDCVGHDACEHLTTNSFETALGEGALFMDTSGENTAVGFDALLNNTTGGGQTAVGANALQAQSGGQNNTAMGTNAESTNVSGQANTAFGFNADAVNLGYNQTAIGNNALVLSTGGGNTALGNGAGSSITSGTGNTVIGLNAASATLTTGGKNILIGGFNGGGLDTPLSSTSNFLNIGNTLFGINVNSGTLASPAGSIGIGTSAPATTLDVNGDITMETGTAGAMLCLTSAHALGHCTAAASCTGTCTCTCAAN